MNGKSRLASYVPKGKEKQAMKQQKAMLIALIVICLTVIVTALVTRKILRQVRIRTGQTEVAVFVDYESRVISDQAGERNLPPPLMCRTSNAPALNPLWRFFLLSDNKFTKMVYKIIFMQNLLVMKSSSQVVLRKIGSLLLIANRGINYGTH